MSEKTLNFLAKVEAWHFEKKWLHFVLAFAAYALYTVIRLFIMPYSGTWPHNAYTIIANPALFLTFWGLIVTAFREKKYGDRLVRLSVVAFLGIWSLAQAIHYVYTIVTIDYSLSSWISILTLVLFVVAWVVGLKFGKKAVRELEEKGFSQQDNQDF